MNYQVRMKRKPIDEAELLQNTLDEYLEAFNAHQRCTPENVINAFYYFYRDINIANLFFENNPENDYLLNNDRLYISLIRDFCNYYFLEINRVFHFSDAVETIWFGYQLYFEEDKITENIFEEAVFDKMRNPNYGNELEKFLESPHYLKLKDKIPTKVELYINYDV